MVYYVRRQQNIQQSRQKHTIKHKEEHNIQKDKKYTKLNYKNTTVTTALYCTVTKILQNIGRKLRIFPNPPSLQAPNLGVTLRILYRRLGSKTE